VVVVDVAVMVASVDGRRVVGVVVVVGGCVEGVDAALERANTRAYACLRSCRFCIKAALSVHVQGCRWRWAEAMGKRGGRREGGSPQCGRESVCACVCVCGGASVASSERDLKRQMGTHTSGLLRLWYKLVSSCSAAASLVGVMRDPTA
jgi:hypothetical protein